jgi:hypothetical protein
LIAYQKVKIVNRLLRKDKEIIELWQPLEFLLLFISSYSINVPHIKVIMTNRLLQPSKIDD